MFEDFTLTELRGFRKELAANLMTGALRVRFQDRDVTFMSQDEMRKTLVMLDGSIAQLSGVSRVRQIRTYPNGKGFDL